MSSPLTSELIGNFSNRLVTLCDGRSGLRRGLQVEVRPPAETADPARSGHDPLVANSPAEASSRTRTKDEDEHEKRTQRQRPTAESGAEPAILDFIASTESVDRFGEIITAGGWRLENYRRNPVFQNAHQYGDVMFTLGKALITEVRLGAPERSEAGSTPQSAIPGRRSLGEVGRNPHLFQRVQFAVEANPMARIAYQLYQGGFLNAVSVGFIPLRWENGSTEAGYRRKYLEQELLEVSAVGIPANPEALQLGLKAGAVAKSDLLELLELVSSRIGTCIPERTIVGNGRPETPTGFGVRQSPAALAVSFAQAHSYERLPSKAAEDCRSPKRCREEAPQAQFRSEMAAPNSHASASGVRGNEAQLLQLARALKQILRRS